MGYYVDVNVYTIFEDAAKVYDHIICNKDEFENLIEDYKFMFGATGLKFSGYCKQPFSDYLASLSKLIDGHIYASFEANSQPGLRINRMYAIGLLVGDYEIDLDNDTIDRFRNKIDPEYANKQTKELERLSKLSVKAI